MQEFKQLVLFCPLLAPLRIAPPVRPRVAVIGAGHVGSITTLRLAESDLFAEVLLVDVVDGLAAGSPSTSGQRRARPVRHNDPRLDRTGRHRRCRLRDHDGRTGQEARNRAGPTSPW